ncbi:hypothetical protein Syun_026102 [Stephania yunnanensis]|uniref:Lachrymatory factor synthase n=1 Tax=Stephania yunnanensis TaxID=152371 RepID=A0AAP0HVF0_9MAGN
MEAEEVSKKWEGRVSAKVRGPRAEQVWTLLQDFFNFHNYFPSLATCHGIQGISGEPGCVRYCSGSSIRSSDGHSGSWSQERLVAVDAKQRSFSYEISESNIGFKSYVATMKVVDIDEEEEGELKGLCVIEWSFEVEAVEGWELDDLVSMYQAGLVCMARRIEDLLGS